MLADWQELPCGQGKVLVRQKPGFATQPLNELTSAHV